MSLEWAEKWAQELTTEYEYEQWAEEIWNTDSCPMSGPASSRPREAKVPCMVAEQQVSTKAGSVATTDADSQETLREASRSRSPMPLARSSALTNRTRLPTPPPPPPPPHAAKRPPAEQAAQRQTHMVASRQMQLGNPFLKPKKEDLMILKTGEQILRGIDLWDEQMSALPPNPPKVVLHIMFRPEPAVRAELQLHAMATAMGFPVYAKGTSVTRVPVGIQGGQEGQWSVCLHFSKHDLSAKATLQMESKKGCIMLKCKRHLVSYGLMRKVIPFLGNPQSVSMRSDTDTETPVAKGRQPLFAFFEPSHGSTQSGGVHSGRAE